MSRFINVFSPPHLYILYNYTYGLFEIARFRGGMVREKYLPYLATITIFYLTCVIVTMSKKLKKGKDKEPKAIKEDQASDSDSESSISSQEEIRLRKLLKKKKKKKQKEKNDKPKKPSPRKKTKVMKKKRFRTIFETIPPSNRSFPELSNQLPSKRTKKDTCMTTL